MNNGIALMNRPARTFGTSIRFGLPTGGACCCVNGADGHASAGMIPTAAWVIGAAAGWTTFYQQAYTAAVEQVAANDRRRRALGHSLPSEN